MDRVVYDRMAEHDSSHWWYVARRDILHDYVARYAGASLPDPKRERLHLTESTLWSGAPSAQSVNPAARQQIPAVRELLFAGRYTEADRQLWIDAWSQPGSTTAGLNYYRANHRNPPFNDRHPASTVAHSWSAKEVTEGAKSSIIKVPTLVIWGMKDTAVLTGNLSGLDRWVPSLSVKLYPDDDHWVMMEKYAAISFAACASAAFSWQI